MKSVKIFSVCLAAVLALSSCASSWLDQELTGGSLTQEEYNSMSNVAVGTVKGIYASMYQYGGGHDEFGQKCIDIATDLVSSDLAMAAKAYGWFTTDAQRLTSYRTGYIWVYYYDIVKNANAVLRSLDHKTSLTDEEKGAYAQALTMRAYCYYNMANLYGPAAGDVTTPAVYGRKGKGPDYDLVPIYHQDDTTAAGLPREQGLSTLKQVREFVRQDLIEAIDLFEESGYSRSSKLFVNADIARVFLAYNYLQMAWCQTEEDELTPTACYEAAYNAAMEVIDGGAFQILKYDEVLTTGFVDVNHKSWMWGLNVTSENSTGLASFWGQMDVHTYSYAYAGALKGCDSELYAQIREDDKRKEWFDANNKYVPDWKFYDLNRGVTADEIDRDWKNDIVYMRIEEAYLIAAEAACRAGKISESKEVLGELLAERFEDASFVDNLGAGELLKEIYMNWRIEMFAEGRALSTWKRFAADGSDYALKNRGSNHFAQPNEEMKAYDYAILYIMPASEANNNNEISQ